MAEQNFIQKGLSRILGVDNAIEKSLASGDAPGGAKGYVDVVPQSSQPLGAKQPTNYQTLYRIYKQESWIRACVDAWRRTGTASGWEIVPVDQKNVDSNQEKLLLDFFNYPNPDETMNDILDGIFTDLGIYGNAYIEVVRGADDLPKEVWNLDATSMRVKYDDHGYVVNYIQNLGSNKVIFEPEEVLHFRLGSKGSTQYGMSPIETLISTVDTDLKAQIYTRKYFENFGSPKGLFKMKNATPEQVRRNRLYLATQVAGIENAHRNLMLEGDVDYSVISSEFKDTQSLEVRKFLRDEMMAVYGVPPSKISIIESGNIGGGTGKSQDDTFNKETIYPLQNKISAKINLQLIRLLFGIEDYRLQFVRQNEEDELQKAKVRQIYLQNGVLSINEVRTTIGYEALTHNDLETEGQGGILDPTQLYDANGKPVQVPNLRETISIAENPDGTAIAADGGKAPATDSSTQNPKGQNNDPAPVNQKPTSGKGKAKTTTTAEAKPAKTKGKVESARQNPDKPKPNHQAAPPEDAKTPAKKKPAKKPKA
jgi:HK97 family phage portal protein